MSTYHTTLLMELLLMIVLVYRCTTAARAVSMSEALLIMQLSRKYRRVTARALPTLEHPTAFRAA